MFLSRFVRAALALLWLCLSLAAAAANPVEVDRGLAWLAPGVQADGTLSGEAASVATAFQARTETLLTLKQLSTAPVSLADRIAQENAEATEYLAREITALAAVGRDVSAARVLLLSFQNADGGFGGTAGYASHALDTAHALVALKAAGGGDATAIGKALAWLTANQAADGAFQLNGQSSVFITAAALQALSAHAQSFALTAAIQSARTWLVGRQAAGAYPTVAENAVAALAIAGSTLDAAAFSGPQNALKAAQAANGSWSDDPYLTALALRALMATASAPPPATTGQISGLVVDNASNAPLAGVSVQVSGAQSATATTDAGGAFTVAGLAPGSYTVQLSKAGFSTVVLTTTVSAGVVSNVGTIRFSAATTTASVQGIVRDGATGLPLAGATVSVTGAPSVSTDANGAYQFAGLLPGTVTITVAKTGYESVSATASLAAGVVNVFSPSLYAPGQAPTQATLQGRVADLASGQPIAGATVTVGSASATTTATGTFSLAGLSTGAATVTVSAAGFNSATYTATLAGGVNDVGTIALARPPASATISGRVFDASNNLPIGGAVVKLAGSAASATTNSNGNYQLAGITQTQFSLAVSAAGFQSRNVAVTLPALADSTVDVPLERVPPSTISLIRAATNLPSYDPFGAVEIEVEVQNTSATPAQVLFTATVLDPLGNVLHEVPGILATIGANALVEVELETHLAADPAGAYSVLVRGFDAFQGTLLLEGTASFQVNAIAKLAGGVTLAPPIAQAGTNQPIAMSANLSNLGNLPIPAGGLEMSVTLIANDPDDVPRARAEVLPGSLVGTPLNNPKGAGFDAQGNFYTVNAADRKVLKWAADGQVTTVATLPALFSAPNVSVSPADSVVDAAGNVYVLNSTQEIFRIAPDGSIGRIRTNILTQSAFDRDTAGNFYVVTTTAEGTAVARLDATGTTTAMWPAAGFNRPWGVVRAGDGNFYVTDRTHNAIRQVTPQGVSTPFVSTGLSSPQGIILAADGALLVANNGGTTLSRVGLDKQVTVYATGLSGPADMAMDAQGAVFVTNFGDNTVSRVPPGGGAAQVFARSIVTSPQGMAYDAAGNLFVAGNSGPLARLDTGENITTLAASLSSARAVAIGFGGDVFVANSGDGRITRTPAGGGPTTTFATGLQTPYGLAFDGSGTLYVTEAGTNANRILAFDAAGASSVVAEALVNNAQDFHVAANGDRYVLNNSYIARTPAAGGPVTIFARGGFFASAFAPDGAGGFYLQENFAIKRVSAAGVVTTFKASMPFPGHGIVVEPSGNLLVTDSSGRKLLRVDGQGNVTTVATFADTPSAIVANPAGGVYVAFNTGRLGRVAADGAVQILAASSLGTINRLALDAAANKLYLLNTVNIRAFDLATNTLAAGQVACPGCTVLAHGDGRLLVYGTFERELRELTPQGALLKVIPGFVNLGPIAWDGSRLLFSEAGRVLSLVPGGYPTFVAAQGNWRHFALSGGALYASLSSTVSRFRPGVDTAFQPYQSLSSAVQGIAFRADGALAVAVESEHRVVVYNAAKQVIASYAGIQGPAGIAVDAAGDVFVGSTSIGHVVRIAANSKQSTVFATSVFANGLRFSAAGELHASTTFTLLRLSATGAPTTVASGGSQLRSFTFADGTPYVADSGAAMVRRVAGTQLEAFVAGVSSPGGLRADNQGGALVASSANGTVVRVNASGASTAAINLESPISLAFAPSGQLLAGGLSGHLWAVDGEGRPTELINLAKLFGVARRMDSLAVNAAGTIRALASFGAPRVDSIAFIPAVPAPPVGTVVHTGTASFPGLSVDNLPLPVSFGSWTPPHAGDFRVAVKLAGSSIPGEAVNVLHVGPHATGEITTSAPIVPPGDSTIGVTARIEGADFTTLSKVDAANISVAISTGIFPSAMGADAAGNILVTTMNDRRLRSFPANGAPAVTLHELPSGQVIGMRGTVPVDDAQNAYISGGVGNRDLIRVAPDRTATTIATLTESITSLVRGSGDVIYALGTTRIWRIPPGGPAALMPTTPVASPYAMTIDGRDNLYVQLLGNVVNMYRPDGTSSVLLRPDASGVPTFEYEGMNIAGDCADNLFVTPNNWPAVGQLGEEYTLVQIVGRTGKFAQVLNGQQISPQLLDLDHIVYDRFTGTLLMWTDLSGGRMYRIPVTCGALNTDLHIVFPAAQPASGFSVAPKAVLTRADGSKEYVWGLKDVTHLGKSVAFSTTLPGLKLGDVVPVASEAFLAFQNTFVPGEVKLPLSVPTVGVDGMVDLAVSTDRPQYEANTDVLGNVRLANRDTLQAKAGILTVEITDPQGVRVALSTQQAVTIPAGGVLDVAPPFNTGTYLSGSYLMNATLNDVSGVQMAVGSTGFDIVAGPVTLISSITTDKQAYETFDTVNLTGRVKNVSLNAISGSVALALTVRDPAGQAVLTATNAVGPLVPQSFRDAVSVLRLSAAPAGTYNVEQRLLDAGGAVLETRTASFLVLSTADTGTGLRGSLTATRLINQGDSAGIALTLRNMGNAALVDLPVTIRIVNPANGVPVQQWNSTVSIPQGGQQVVNQNWLTGSATAAGVYVASATATFAGREIALGQANITVGAVQPFAFAPVNDVALNTVVESNAVTIAGIVAPAPISITEGEYRIGDGGWTAVTGLVNPGDVVRVRVTSAGTFNTTTTAQLTVAGFTAPFDVRTLNPDITPDAFSFEPQVNVPLASLRTSNTVTITGIDIAVPVSIVGGEYSINGGAWTSAAGTIASGSTVAVRLLSSSLLGTTTTATLTVSNVSATFSVTTTAEDRTPDPFAFQAQNGVPRESLRTSNTVTIAGINVAVPISIVGGEYSVNGGAFTAAPGTVASGNTVTVRQTSAAAFETTTTARLTVSDFTANFSVTTEGEDRTPDTFAFNSQPDVPLASVRTSNPVTVTGVNVAVPISIAGGEYSINGGAFTSAPGTVSANDVVVVRQTSSSSFATTTTATLTVSGFSAAFEVTTKALADLTTLPALNADGRLLVLVSCKIADETVEDPPCSEQRRAFLDGYLTSLGIAHTIVTTTEAFRVEFRSGRYNVYWISGGAEKLHGTLAEEIREAAFRGETLVIDGVHDERNKTLDEVVGMIFKGKPSGLTTVTLGSALLPAGTFNVNGTRPIRVELSTAVRHARFNSGDPAIATSRYGAGRGLLFAFDLTGTLLAQSASALLRETLDDALAVVTPPVPLAFTGGAYVPLAIDLRNAEPVAVDLEITATLPAGFTLAAGAPPATLSGSTVTWRSTVPAGGTLTLDWAVRTPEASGSYSIPIVVKQVYGTSVVDVGTYAIAIEVRGIDTQLGRAIADVQALALTTATDRNARDAAVGKLQEAQARIAAAAYEDAVLRLVEAVDLLDRIAGANVAPHQVAIDGVMQEVARRWWSALPPCPATTLCRS